MNAAPTLFDQTESIDESFWEFHTRNPHVYRLLVRFAREAHDAGKRIGIRAIWERMRWELFFTTTDPDFKLNDHMTSRYARLIMRNEPDLAGFFETRRLRS